MNGRDQAASADRRQPITSLMRVMHRMSSYVPVERHRLSNAKPLVSFTFDDVPDSAVRRGARILNSAGVRGTFFVTTSLLGRVTADWRVADARDIAALADDGHEVGLHSHQHVPSAYMGARAFQADMLESERRLALFTPSASVENYAYPFGFSNPLHRACLRRRVRSSRTTHPGINKGRTDLHGLQSYGVGEHLAEPSRIDDLLDRVSGENGWLILTIHDVRDNPSRYGCTPALLEHAVTAAQSRQIKIASITQALDDCGVPGRAS